MDLVVLSACRTGVSGEELGTGEEILGFGYQVQRTGARGAIASLWQVGNPLPLCSDRSHHLSIIYHYISAFSLLPSAFPYRFSPLSGWG